MSDKSAAPPIPCLICRRPLEPDDPIVVYHDIPPRWAEADDPPLPPQVLHLACDNDQLPDMTLRRVEHASWGAAHVEIVAEIQRGVLRWGGRPRNEPTH